MVEAARIPEKRLSEIRGDIAPRVSHILRALGEDPERPGLLDTPARVERSLRELTRGYHQDLDTVLNGALFPSEYRDLVLVRDIDVYSLCEHHLLPFFGKAHVAYLPDGQVIGLSKIPRIVEMYARRLQLQENLSEQIARAIEQVAAPRGVAVALSCEHLCLTMRGVCKPGSTTVTRTLTGAFRTDEQARAELVALAGGGSDASRLWG